MNEIPTIRPWLVYNDREWLLCLQCPTDKVTKINVHYYLGINTRKKTRRQIRRFVMNHLSCGFKGLK